MLQEAQEWGDASAVGCDGVGRTVIHQSQQVCPIIRVVLPAPVARPSGAAHSYVTGDVHPNGPRPARLGRRVRHTPGPERAPRGAAKRPL
jgi:hypothetical protein